LQVPIGKVLAFWFKPSIKGVWYVDGQAYAVLINARKGQRLFPDHVRFLARGVYELHCIDDPADPIPLILDVSQHEEGEKAGYCGRTSFGPRRPFHLRSSMTPFVNS
jgi:hypothetical protein